MSILSGDDAVAYFTRWDLLWEILKLRPLRRGDVTPDGGPGLGQKNPIILGIFQVDEIILFGKLMSVWLCTLRDVQRSAHATCMDDLHLKECI